MQNIIEGELYGYSLKLEIIDNLVLVESDSGSNKSLVFQYLDDISLCTEQKNLICINNKYAIHIRRNNESEEEAILNVLKGTSGKYIIIDNADTLLTPKIKEYIVIDTNNKYLLFGRNVEGLWTNENKLAELVVDHDKKQFYLKYTFKEE